MDREEIEAIQMRAEEEYEMIKDKCHDLYDENQKALKEIEKLKFIIQCLLELKLEDEDYDKIYEEHKNLKEIGAIQWEIKKGK